MPPSTVKRALLTSLLLWAVISPLSTYNTFAMFGLVESRYVPIQLGVTAFMILFATIAGRHFGRHCSERCETREKRLWTAGFYLIGPPVLYAYYKLRYQLED